MHRDLKPGNILYRTWINGRKTWKLTDFGASVKKDSKLKTTVRERMTVAYASLE